MKFAALLLLSSVAIQAAVEDRIQLFSAKAIAAADAKLEKIKAKTQKEILFLIVPDLSGKSISAYVRDEAIARKLNGVLVLISKNPRQLEVNAGRKTALVFNKLHRDKVVKILSENLRKAPDAALQSAVDFIVETFAKAKPVLIQPDEYAPPVPPAAPARSTNWYLWLVALGGVLVASGFAIRVFYRRASRSDATPSSGDSTAGKSL